MKLSKICAIRETDVSADPDAPTRSDPKMRERVHWLVGNIPGDRWEAGETLIAYVPSCPPKASGLHRYTFVLLRQPVGAHK